MACVKKRLKDQDIPSTYSEAKKLTNIKLKRSKNYMIIDSEVCELAEWTQSCSGCSCGSEGPCSCCQVRGSGCEECGYTGKSRQAFWVPLMDKNRVKE